MDEEHDTEKEREGEDRHFATLHMAMMYADYRAERMRCLMRVEEARDRRMWAMAALCGLAATAALDAALAIVLRYYAGMNDQSDILLAGTGYIVALAFVCAMLYIRFRYSERVAELRYEKSKDILKNRLSEM